MNLNTHIIKNMIEYLIQHLLPDLLLGMGRNCERHNLFLKQVQFQKVTGLYPSFYSTHTH